MNRILVIFISALLFSCSKGPAYEEVEYPAAGEVEKAILNVNQYITKRNRDHINGFIKRSNWDMQQTGSGLWYEIRKEGEGEAASSGKQLRLQYEMRLINGELISSSQKNGPLILTVGQSSIVSGLQEALYLMKEDSEMRLLLPPHLAYGNFGDSQLGVPPDAILIFKIKVLEIT